MAFWRPEQVELAYSESWALVHFLMQPERRTKFFLYIRYIRDPANFWEARRGPAFDLLARFLDTKPELLAIEWLDYVAKL